MARIRGHGLDGLRQIVEQHAVHLAGAPDWDAIAHERHTWPALLNALEQHLGHAPPLVELARTLALDATECWLIITLWGLSMSPATAAHEIPPGRLATMTFAHETQQRDAAAALAPGGRLRRHGLVRARRPAPPDSDSDSERISLAPDVSAFLQGLWPSPAADAVHVRGTGAALVSAPPALARPLAELYRHIERPRARLALLGAPGAGKRTLVRAVTSQRDIALIEVTLARCDPARALLTRCARDALLYRAVLYIALADHTLPERIAAILDQAPGIIILGIPTRGDSEATAAAARAAWPALTCVPLPPLGVAEQPAAWTTLLTDLAPDAPAPADLDHLESDLEAHACRPDLVIGDLDRAARAALARLRARAPDTAARPSGRDLGTALAEHLPLDHLAERLWPMASARVDAPDPAWADLARTVREGQQIVDAWGPSMRTSRLPSPLVAHVRGGGHRVAVARARSLARALSMPLYRVDLGYLADIPADRGAAYLRTVLAAADRCGAILLMAPAARLASAPHTEPTAALAEALQYHTGVILLFDPTDAPLPAPVQPFIDCTVSAAP